MSSAQKMHNPKAKELAESNVAKLWEEALHKAAKTEDTASSSSSSMQIEYVVDCVVYLIEQIVQTSL